VPQIWPLAQHVVPPRQVEPVGQHEVPHTRAVAQHLPGLTHAKPGAQHAVVQYWLLGQQMPVTHLVFTAQQLPLQISAQQKLPLRQLVPVGQQLPAHACSPGQQVPLRQSSPGPQSSIELHVAADAEAAESTSATGPVTSPPKTTPAVMRSARRRDIGEAQIRVNSSKRLPSPTLPLSHAFGRETLRTGASSRKAR